MAFHEIKKKKVIQTDRQTDRPLTFKMLSSKEKHDGGNNFDKGKTVLL